MRKRSYELVIYITSIGEFTFLFYFINFPHLQFIVGEFGILYCANIFFLVFILTNINLFGSLVFVGFLLVYAVFIAAYAVGQKHCRQIGKAQCSS